MINRVSGNDIYSNPYNEKNVKVINTDENIPPFMLDYDDKGVIWEREKKDKTSKPDKAPAKDTLELSNTAATMQKKQDAAVEPNNKETGSVLSKFWNSVKQVLYRAFSYVWYGPEEKAKTDENINENTGGVSNNREMSDENEENIENVAGRNIMHKNGNEKKNNDSEAVRQLAMDYVKDSVPARNSDIYTTYDKNGRINHNEGIKNKRSYE